MSHNLLKGKRGIIFGALNEMSIAWKVAERAVEEGAIITLSNTPVAVRMGEVDALAKKLNAEVLPADATSVEDLEMVFSKSVEILGGKIDFVLHSIGMSPNVRKKRTYDDLDYGMLEKTLDISAVSFHKMLQVAKNRMLLHREAPCWPCRMWQHNVHSSVTTIWPMPRACWNRLHAASDISMDAKKGFVSIRSLSRRQ